VSSSRFALHARPFELVSGAILRYSLVLFLILFGLAKFTEGEALTIQPWVAMSPFLSWLYAVTSVQGASDVIGVVELIVGVLLAIRPWWPLASVIDSLGATIAFAITFSFLFTTPGLLPGVVGVPDEGSRAARRGALDRGGLPPRDRATQNNDAMTNYVPSVEQLVVEIFVRNAERSKNFYQQLGFQIAEDRGTFVVLTWEGHELFLDERPDLPLPAGNVPQANVRVMVADVNAYWQRASAMNATVLAPIADREYGLRDFTILDPDGFGIRFGSLLRQQSPHVD